jgi:alkylated DNA repair dioxygenase AlkB
MDLFSSLTDSSKNILPKDGTVNYYGKIFSLATANRYLNNLLNGIEWKNDEAFILGKLIITKRKVAWYADTNFEYTYSNITKRALPFTKELLQLKSIVELKTGEQFNSCLLNLYHTGEEGMAWHSDAEKDLKKNGGNCLIEFWSRTKILF